MRVLQWHHERDGSRNYGVYIPCSLFEQLVQLRARSGPGQLNFGGALAAALEDAATEISTLLDQLAATVFRDRAQEGRNGRGWGSERRCLPVSLIVKHGI
jgi:hypothetical protein